MTTATAVPHEFRPALRALAAAQKPARGAPAYSRFVNRRLGRVLAAAAHRFRLTPDAVTVLAACTRPSRRLTKRE